MRCNFHRKYLKVCEWEDVLNSAVVNPWKAQVNSLQRKEDHSDVY